MRNIKYLVVHCSYTPEGRDVKTQEIKRWHTQERGWSDIGYHCVIELDGTVHEGRPDEKIGSGVKGHNKNSIHICYVGGMDKSGETSKDTRTEKQKESLIFMLNYYKTLYPKSVVLGHRDFNGVKKDCPSFDALNEYKHISSLYMNL